MRQSIASARGEEPSKGVLTNLVELSAAGPPGQAGRAAYVRRHCFFGMWYQNVPQILRLKSEENTNFVLKFLRARSRLCRNQFFYVYRCCWNFRVEIRGHRIVQIARTNSANVRLERSEKSTANASNSSIHHFG